MEDINLEDYLKRVIITDLENGKLNDNEKGGHF